MQIHEQIRELKHYDAEGRLGITYAVVEALSEKLPKLSLPTMGDEARAAFRALLAYEAPPANGSLLDTLALVEARGYTVHPCDWIPNFSWQYAGRHPAIYQSWTNYLSENGYTRFHKGNTLTPDNCQRFPAEQRKQALRDYIRRYDPDKLEYARTIINSQPADVRAQLLGEVDAGGAFNGVYPWQVPFIQEFLEDKSQRVRETAKALLARGGGWNSDERYAQLIAGHLNVSDDTVTFREPPEHPAGFLFKEFCCVSFAGLARAVGLSSKQLAERVDLDGLGSNFSVMAAISANLEARSILARRALDEGKGGQSIPLAWFKDVDPDLWQRGLEAMKGSPYVNSVQEYLGDKTGTMSAAEMLEWHAFESMRKSVTCELETGKLPVNIAYDPLRYLGKVVDKEAAQIILDEAIRLGMKFDNSRLTMLKLNLAL